MEFALFMKQAGEGCDYMIGCGQKVVFFEAESVEAAIAKVMADDDDDKASLLYYGMRYDDGDGDHQAEAIRLFRMDSSVDLMPFLAAKAVNEVVLAAEKAYKDKENRERSEFERLQKKFGKG